MNRRVLFAKGLVAVLVLLLVVLTVSVTVSLKDGSASGIPGYSYALSAPLSGWDDSRLQRKPGEPEIEFAKRANKEVSQAYYHCKFSSTFGLAESIASQYSRTYKVNGFVSPDRPCGFCHQSAFILANALDLQGLDAKPLGVNGHVVVLANIGGESLIFDPDVGIGPFAYENNMWDQVADQYPEGISKSPTWASAFDTAYATKADDGPYYSLAWFRKAEAEQHEVLLIVKIVLYGLIAQIFLPLLWGVKQILKAPK